MSLPPTVTWQGGAAKGDLVIIDQTRLPRELIELRLNNLDSVIDAIKRLAVRGAPAIGVAGAYGCVIALRSGLGDKGLTRLAEARPTAVNLKWAVDRVRAAAKGDPARALKEAKLIHESDIETCAAIGRHGAKLIKNGSGVLTHCNAGALATAGMGTALAPMFTAHKAGRKFSVFADETRPLAQGARLTSFELAQSGIDVTVITDSMAAVVMREGRVQLAIVGADRIARNGDTANKIGTYGVATLCKAHDIPFYVAAPKSTFDAKLKSGKEIPIEQRDENEIRRPGGVQLVPDKAKVYNPAFDVTPARLIAGFITEDGILQADDLADWLSAPPGRAGV
ncbi:MAG: S-methyl-5-thioribose-1-phosphate isomerase [Planctomycetes bacterium]|nr:S-methyl-5-thioribose-1-phosphate isomerase [Planctomycetota bacterium]